MSIVPLKIIIKQCSNVGWLSEIEGVSALFNQNYSFSHIRFNAVNPIYMASSVRIVLLP